MAESAIPNASLPYLRRCRDLYDQFLDVHEYFRDELTESNRVYLAQLNAEIARRIPQGPAYS